MEVFPTVTNIHINIVDILITLVYSKDARVWRGGSAACGSRVALFKDTWLLQVIYEAISNVGLVFSSHSQPSISPLKSQLCIFLQAVAACCKSSAAPPSPAVSSAPSVRAASERPRPSVITPVLNIGNGEVVNEPFDGAKTAVPAAQEDSLLTILQSCEFFLKILSVVDIFHIYEPLVRSTVGSLGCGYA